MNYKGKRFMGTSVKLASLDIAIISRWLKVPRRTSGCGNQEHARQKEGPLLSIDDMLMDFTTSDIQCVYFYMSSIIS